MFGQYSYESYTKIFANRQMSSGFYMFTQVKRNMIRGAQFVLEWTSMLGNALCIAVTEGRGRIKQKKKCFKKMKSRIMIESLYIWIKTKKKKQKKSQKAGLMKKLNFNVCFSRQFELINSTLK